MSTDLEMVNPVAVGRDTLLCPKCGEDNLHHGRVHIYERPEDQPWVRQTVIEDDAINSSVAIGSTGNPSRRRHGLAIEFFCEQCGDVGELTIAQHKGQTLIRWR